MWSLNLHVYYYGVKADLVLNSDHFVGYYETMKGEKERGEGGRERDICCDMMMQCLFTFTSSVTLPSNWQIQFIYMHSVLVEQVIVEKVPKSAIPDIDKKKFLVPADLSGKYEIMKLLYNSTQLFYVFSPFFSVRPPPP